MFETLDETQKLQISKSIKIHAEINAKLNGKLGEKLIGESIEKVNSTKQN